MKGRFNDRCMVPRMRADVIQLINGFQVEIVGALRCAECKKEHQPKPRPFDNSGIIQTCENCGELLFRIEHVR
jgi:hypothetical protein